MLYIHVYTCKSAWSDLVLYILWSVVYARELGRDGEILNYTCNNT